MSYATDIPFGFEFGYDLLHKHDHLRHRMARFRTVDRLGFIGACIASGIDTEQRIAHKVDQLMSPMMFGVRQLLDRGAGANKKSKLWHRNADGRYALTALGRELVEPEIKYHGSLSAS